MGSCRASKAAGSKRWRRPRAGTPGAEESEVGPAVLWYRFRRCGRCPAAVVPASPPREPTLADLLDAVDRLADTGFHDVELRLGNSRIRVVRREAVGAAAPSVSLTPQIPTAGGAAPDPASGASSLDTITAPMVGTFYRRPRPDAEPFVTVGDQVKKGQVLCIIEAMKLMNNIEAEAAGEIVEILAEDTSPVQFGDRLFAIRPS